MPSTQRSLLRGVPGQTSQTGASRVWAYSPRTPQRSTVVEKSAPSVVARSWALRNSNPPLASNTDP